MLRFADDARNINLKSRDREGRFGNGKSIDGGVASVKWIVSALDGDGLPAGGDDRSCSRTGDTVTAGA